MRFIPKRREPVSKQKPRFGGAFFVSRWATCTASTTALAVQVAQRSVKISMLITHRRPQEGRFALYGIVQIS